MKDYFRNRLGIILWSKLEEALEAIYDHDEVDILSGNGVGKTELAAGLIPWWIETNDEAIAFSVSSNWAALTKVMCPRVHDIIKRAGLFPEFWKLLNDKDWVISERLMWIAQSSDDPQAISGKHSKNIMQVVEESSGIEPPIEAAIKGNTIGGRSKLVHIGNGLRKFGVFYDRCTKPKRNKVIRISSFEHPNVVQGKDIIPGAVSRKDIQNNLIDLGCIRSEEGAKGVVQIPWEWTGDDGVNHLAGEWWIVTNEFRVKFLAEFPEQNSESIFLSKWCEYGKDLFTRLTKEQKKPVAAGCDVAWSEDGDETVIALSNDFGILYFEAHKGWDTVRTAERLAELHTQLKLQRIAVDIGGLGHGVGDELKRLKVPFLGIEFASVALRVERYANKKAEIYWQFREYLARPEGYALPPDELLHRQLPELRKELDGKERTIIESKQKFKTRTSGMSPDRAEACILAAYANRMAKSTGSSLSIYVAKDPQARSEEYSPYGGDGTDRFEYFKNLYS